MNAVGACGLQLYNFGQTVSLVFFTETWKPDSFYDRIKENADIGLHTLVLLDKLDLANIDNYDVQVFPDSDHSINFHNGHTLVYERKFPRT